jgi:glycosyltransferase involved in cell wall biosynthesis
VRVHYLSFDSIESGVGASQVRPYVERVAAAGVAVDLFTFEPQPPSKERRTALEAAGVTWRPRPFGRAAARGGAARVARAAADMRGAGLVHARGDLAAAAAVLAGVDAWVWDMRSFWREQRIELGMLRPNSIEERVLRMVERQAARRSSAIITLAARAVPVLAARHGPDVPAKCAVVPTCVDLDRFTPTPLPEGPVSFLLAGTLNTYYDVPLMADVVQAARRRWPVKFDVLSPEGLSRWEEPLARAGAEIARATPMQMPQRVAASTVGLSVCRNDLGVSLTAAMPTKIAEFLASGRPVLVSPGIGDLDDLLHRYSCGVTLASGDGRSIAAALDQLEQLLSDSELSLRCRRLAVEHFDVDAAVERIVDIYRSVAPP